jgi:hypothetical protein
MKLKNMILKEEKKKEVQAIPVVSTKSSTLPQDMSLDQKVDRYLIQYEREAIPASQMFAGVGEKPIPSNMPTALQKLSELKQFSKILFEADDPDLELGEPGDSPDAGGLDLGGDSNAGDSDKAEVSQEPEVPETMLNIQKFAGNVARLVGNYDVMLDPKTVILNRVYVYLLKNYNEQTAKECMIALKKYYQLSPNSKTASMQSSAGYYAGNGNLSDGGSVPSGGGLGGEGSV